MKPSKLYEALHALIGERVPLHIWGACGVGKSQIVAQVADDLDFEFIDVRAVQLDPVDLRGLPRIKADQTEWVPPKFLPTTGKGILFLDELTSAPQMTQAGCYQLVLDRKLGEYVLPDGWVVIAAGNPASERGVHFSMPRPLRNRFVHLDLEADLNDWCKWAVGTGVRPEIIAFLRFKPDLLHTADATSDANAWPTPRSWEMASNVLRGIARRQKTTFLSGASEFEAQLLDGTVGPAAAAELIAFLRLFRQLPSIDEILLNPETAPLPAETSAQIAIATALGRAMTDNSVARGLKYLDRMPTEMRVMAMRDAAVRDTAITHTPEFVRFGVQHSELCCVLPSAQCSPPSTSASGRLLNTTEGSAATLPTRTERTKALAGTTSSCFTAPTNWMNCARWRGKCGSTSTGSRCRGPTRDSDCCLRISISI